MLPENRKRCYFTTARVIHDTSDREPKSKDWLWINARDEHQFTTAEGAQLIADLANTNGKDNGLDIVNYPYFVVKVTQTSSVEKVVA